MTFDTDTITLAHGAGAKESGQLINGLIAEYFKNDILLKMEDAAEIELSGRAAFTTDSFVISPVFFSGGNIGDIAVCGTVNDLAVKGATPRYISVAFIIEEGFKIKDLEAILKSMRARADEAGVQIVCGDTKVVSKGAADKIFINTSGIGEIADGANISAANAKAGDIVVVSGPLGEHGISIINERESLGLRGLASDTAPLNKITEAIINEFGHDVSVMRDLTRGGLASALNEIAKASGKQIEIENALVPVSGPVRAAAKMFGIDPLYTANEGKFVCIINPRHEDKLIKLLQTFDYSRGCGVCGSVREGEGVYLKTASGAVRKLREGTGVLLPRIC
ncbi:hydrogenase expression/formation protein HypE [Parelusimicrobium proximum]|uniref:hydrogenase expression/formation protein HypE n=1 Tax=Parelusimicrobium proximum TaxID=3228953 RepID=UPI003D180E1F